MFIDSNLSTVLNSLNQLKEDMKPKWGSMTAQAMVEHLTDLNHIAVEKVKTELVTPEKYLHKYLEFLDNDAKMPRNYEVNFVKFNTNRNDNLILAIDEFAESWIAFEDYFEEDESLKTLHPIYGPLDFNQWKRLNSKHITHHFEQFGLIKN